MKRAAILVAVIIFAFGCRPHLARAQASIAQEAGGFNILDLAAPPWMHWLGDGSDGLLTVSAPLSVQGVHYYSSLSVSSTLTVSNTLSVAGTPADQPPGAFIAIVDSLCTISSTISANGMQPHNGFLANIGGGSGGGGSSGNNGAQSNLAGGGGFVPVAVGGTGGGSCSGAGAGSTPALSAQRLVTQNLMTYGECGGATGGSASGGTAGIGGGCIVLICHDLNFTSTGALSAQGTSGSGGAGGGGGGIVITATANLIANNPAGISVSGAGGTTGSGGCIGGNGWFAQYVIQ